MYVCIGTTALVFGFNLSLTDDNSITLPFSWSTWYDVSGFSGEILDFSVDWGDDTVESYGSDSSSDTVVSHSYTEVPDHLIEIQITGQVERINFDAVSASAAALVTIPNLGSATIGMYPGWFEGCTALQSITASQPVLNSADDGLVDTKEMFKDCTSFNSDLSHWDTSSVRFFIFF